MALIDRHATSLLPADSEIVCTFDKVGWCGCVRDLDAPNCEIGNLSDSIRGVHGSEVAFSVSLTNVGGP